MKPLESEMKAELKKANKESKGITKFWGQDYKEKHKLDSKQISDSKC